MTEPEKNFGLSTKESLEVLWNEISDTVKQKKNASTSSYLQRIWLAVFHDDSPIHWFPVLLSLLSVICLFVIDECCPAVIILLLLILTLIVVVREQRLKEQEIFTKVKYVLEDIRHSLTLSDSWTPENYPNVCSPVSPCVTLQCTYRDGEIRNLPWALLVKGDCIVMRPGQTAPGPCHELNGTRVFTSGETYSQKTSVNPPKRPSARIPLPNLICVMDTTPFLENLVVAIDQFLLKPRTIHNRQRHFLVTICVQQWGTVIALIVTLISGFLNSTEFVFSHHRDRHDWEDLFLLNSVSVLVPLLPLLFPVLWISLNLWGTAKLETLTGIARPFDENAETESHKSFHEDLDTPVDVDWDNMRLPFRTNMGNFLGLIQGSGHLLGRSANVVQVLGSITALTCVDKKGILSWPNPTAEKIFFLRDSDQDAEDERDLSTSECESEPESKNGPTTPKQSTVAEVLDLTHDQHSPFRMEFDDHTWKSHINSLKPLGLAILVNTCCPLTQAYYAKFCNHVTAVSLFDKDLVPVTNRYAIVESSLNSFMHGRCLCELAKQIGFSKQARDIFSLEGKVACYRHLQPEVVRRDIRFARSLQISTKVKVPFPHSMSVVMKEAANGSLQLLTQGTADIILDCCDDFWDGQDLKPLRPQDRKRAQDFYQRNALTAYCTAFAYRPLRHGIFGALAGSEENVAYLELPPETKQRMEHENKFKCDFASHDSTTTTHSHQTQGHHHGHLSHSMSTDSLLFNETKDSDVSDVEGCFEMQCHQVFIGMVTMQYQAQTDIVKLIEHLERACIRFVHFSKENELRSRVFSEKMGLESGWNCHISLLSEDADVQSPKNASTKSHNSSNGKGKSALDLQLDEPLDNCLLKPNPLEASKTLSSSAPGAISNTEEEKGIDQQSLGEEGDSLLDSEERGNGTTQWMDSEPCQSLSCMTDSTEDQSVAVKFDMSNRAKLPRGIENIRPHLENVDNVPLLVSLFTDCSAEATKEMLKIMQSYGEVVVCLGSSANATNVEIFLQADLSIGIEPLYPQVCQDYPAYCEANIFHNKKQEPPRNALEKWFPETWNKNKTISPIYLSRMLNSICCSVSVCRDEPLSLIAMVELSRRFTMGLWNCVQFLICCGCSIASINLLSALLALPPVFPPNTGLGLMCVTCPLLATSLARISSDRKIMSKATVKKSTKVGTRLIMFVIWCYGLKFLPLILFVTFSYSAFMEHPLYLIKSEEQDHEDNLKLARIVSLFAIVIHFVTVSSSFVHRDFLFWKRNAFKNRYWTYSSLFLITIHGALMIAQITDDDVVETLSRKWPVMVFVLCSVVVTFFITEICKWQEIKANVRYQRRARLDFGTKLGMNSPF